MNTDCESVKICAPSVAKLHLAFCSQDAARYAVTHWYYREELPRGKVVRIGVWEEHGPHGEGRFCGVILFGMGGGADLGGRGVAPPLMRCGMSAVPRPVVAYSPSRSSGRRRHFIDSGI